MSANVYAVASIDGALLKDQSATDIATMATAIANLCTALAAYMESSRREELAALARHNSDDDYKAWAHLRYETTDEDYGRVIEAVRLAHVAGVNIADVPAPHRHDVAPFW